MLGNSDGLPFCHMAEMDENSEFWKQRRWVRLASPIEGPTRGALPSHVLAIWVAGPRFGVWVHMWRVHHGAADGRHAAEAVGLEGGQLVTDGGHHQSRGPSFLCNLGSCPLEVLLLSLAENMADNVHTPDRVIRALLMKAVEDRASGRDKLPDGHTRWVVDPMEEVHQDGPTSRLPGCCLGLVREPSIGHCQAPGVSQGEIGSFCLLGLLDGVGNIQGLTLPFADNGEGKEVVAKLEAHVCRLQVMEDFVKDGWGCQRSGCQGERDRGRVRL